MRHRPTFAYMGGVERLSMGDYPVDVSGSGARFRFVPEAMAGGLSRGGREEIGFALGLALGMLIVALAL